RPAPEQFKERIAHALDAARRDIHHGGGGLAHHGGEAGLQRSGVARCDAGLFGEDAFLRLGGLRLAAGGQDQGGGDGQSGSLHLVPVLQAWALHPFRLGFSTGSRPSFARRRGGDQTDVTPSRSAAPRPIVVQRTVTGRVSFGSPSPRGAVTPSRRARKGWTSTLSRFCNRRPAITPGPWAMKIACISGAALSYPWAPPGLVTGRALVASSQPGSDAQTIAETRGLEPRTKRAGISLLRQQSRCGREPSRACSTSASRPATGFRKATAPE